MPIENTSQANGKQIEYWNETAGPKWVRLQERLDGQIHPFGQVAIDAAALSHEESVLDVGCGCGQTTIEIARRVGARGTALGVDLSAVMLERARTRSRRAGLKNIRFEQADAQTYSFDPESFDVVFSRFGVMFFEDPERAFHNLRATLRRGGRLAFVCWQSIKENPWMLIPLQAAMKHIKLELPTDPTAPGPFSLAEEARLIRILSAAGFDAVQIAALSLRLTVGGGGDAEQALSFLLEIGPLSRAIADIDSTAREAATRAVREALAPYKTPAGVQMPSAAWIVTARRS